VCKCQRSFIPGVYTRLILHADIIFPSNGSPKYASDFVRWIEGLKDCSHSAFAWRCKLTANVIHRCQGLQHEHCIRIIEQLVLQLTDERPPSCVQAMQILVSAVIQSVSKGTCIAVHFLSDEFESIFYGGFTGMCADVGDENTPAQCSGVGHASPCNASLHKMLALLVQATCSARGKRPLCDTPGSLLGTALDAMHLHGADGLDKIEILYSTVQQISSLMLHGNMSTKNVGSFNALRSGWTQLQPCGLCDGRITSTTLLVIIRALNENKHWTVRLSLVCRT
jgi:hypothetical protein